MADTIVFNEGKNEVGASGLPATCYFLLSTKLVPVDVNAPAGGEFTLTDTLAGGVGEITGAGSGGTPYGRKSQAEPSPSAGVWTFSAMTWDNGGATDWSSTVKSVVLVTSSDGSGKAVAARNLSTTRDMSVASATLQVTPTFRLKNTGET